MSTAEPSKPITRVRIHDVVAQLREIITKGLPAKERAVGELLLNLRSVYARAVVPSDPLARLQAFNDLLPRLIASVSDPDYREALQTLFALAPGTRKANLTERRRRASAILDYSASHFREVVEEELLEAVAMLLHADLLRYEPRVKRSVESLEATGDTPVLGLEHLTHEEELVSRIWEHVYGLRAELIAEARLQLHDGMETAGEDHRQAAARHHERLREVISEYVVTYGSGFVRHGDTEYSVEALERLSGWRLLSPP